MGIIIGIALFIGLIIMHELGHFFAAKKSGVHVPEFGIGIPPKAKRLRKDKKGTEYTLNWIPLGGFVRLKGDDPSNPQEFNAKGSFMAAPLHKKIFILIAGVAINIAFAWILLTTLFTVGVQPITITPENATSYEVESYLMPTITKLADNGFLSGERKEKEVIAGFVVTGGLAEQAGIQSGDIISHIDGAKISTININSTLKSYINKEFEVTFKHNNETKNAMITCPESDCLLGVLIANQYKGMEVKDIKFGLGTAMEVAAKEMRVQTDNTIRALGRLGKSLFSFNGKKIKDTLSRFSGPVGAVKFGDTLIETGNGLQFLAFAALISLALGIFNLLPIPALDGGRILGVLIQSIFKLPKEKYFIIEGYINMIFFILLLGLGIYIIFKDLVVFRGINLPFIG